MLVLQTLSWGAQHGYGITQSIRSGSSDLLQVETGSLYPALHRLEKNGWVKSAWKRSENNQRAKYYSLTAAGQETPRQRTNSLGSDDRRDWRTDEPKAGRNMSIRSRFRGWRRFHEDLDEEIRGHLEMAKDVSNRPRRESL